MIKVKLYLNGLVVSGHSNAAPKGKDIYCAGVSAIVQGSLNWFEQDDIDYEIQDGFLSFVINNKTKENIRKLELLEIQLWSLKNKDNEKYIQFNRIKKEL